MPYILGLDLAQMQDFTALAVVERQSRPSQRAEYAVRELVRFPLGTKYPTIINGVRQLLERPIATDPSIKPLRGSLVAVDATGVGVAVMDMLREARLPCRLCPITITAGERASSDGGGWHVPKKDLVSVLQTMFQAHRLKVSKELPEAKTLVRELQNFQVQITAAGNETFGAWREGTHDDLVLAVALAAWLAERANPATTSRPFAAGGMERIGGTLYSGNHGFQL